MIKDFWEKLQEKIGNIIKEPTNNNESQDYIELTEMWMEYLTFIKSKDKGKEKEEKEKDKTEEHYQPWRLKEKYELIHTFEPKFNRLVMFDAEKHCHGQNIHSKSEFFRTNQARLNQVFFYDGKSNKNT